MNRFEVGDIVRFHIGEAPQEVIQVHNNDRISTAYIHTHHQSRYRKSADFTFFETHPKEDHMTTSKTNTDNSLLVALLQAQRGVKTASVRISGTPKNQNQTYTFKVRPGLTIAPKDRVIVQCSKTQKVAEVLEVHDTAQIDPEADFEYRWIFQRLDTEWLSAIEKEETDLRHTFVNASLMDKLAQVARTTGLDVAKISTPMLEVNTQ